MHHFPDVIVGHDKQRGQLVQDVADGNVSHAYLFLGAPSLGKMTVAHWFAHMLLSDHVAPEARSQVRIQMEKFIHPDFLCLDDLWMEGVQEDWATITKSSNAPQHHRSKATTAKTDLISIDDIRTLTERLHDTGDGPRFVCIIRGVERMQAAAANAFLKILEEPPPRVLFILTTDNPNAVLTTIVSRTRVLRFSPLTRKQMAPLLEGEDEEDASFAWHIAQGAPGMMMRLLRDPELLRSHRQMHAQARHFWQAPALQEKLSWLMSAADDKKGDPDTAILHLALSLREHPDPIFRAQAAIAYANLLRHLQTNAHRGLLLERFALAIDDLAC